MTSIAQRKVLIGKETTPADGATPDVALRAIATLKATVDKRVPEEYIGSFAPRRHYIASIMAEGRLQFRDLYYEHSPYPVSMAMGAGTVAGTVDPYTYTFTLAGTAGPPTFATYRMEYTDGGNHIVRADDVFATALEISGEAGGPIAINATVVGASVTYPAAVGATLDPVAAPTQA